MPNSVGRLAVRAASHADLHRALHGDVQAAEQASGQALQHDSPLEPVQASEPGLAPVPGLAQVPWQGRSQTPTRIERQPEWP